jgi:hypothetical protein
MRGRDDAGPPSQTWERFAQVVGPGGVRRSELVPVLGSGMRAWVGDRVLPAWFRQWPRLVEQLARQVAVDDFERGHSLTADFERLVEAYRALRPEMEPLAAENALIATHVRQALRAQPYRRFPSLTAKTGRFARLGFRDVIDLGIDDVFSDPAEPGAVIVGSLSGARTTTVRTVHGTRFWHPHGSVRAEAAPSQVVLGVERYGRSVAATVTAFQRHAHWVRQNPADAAKDVRTTSFRLEHWAPLALHAPLLLIGTSLGDDDWDLVWFLRMRRRAQAMYGCRAPVFRLTCGADDDAGKVASYRATTGIEALHGGRTWKDAWARLFAALGAV